MARSFWEWTGKRRWWFLLALVVTAVPMAIFVLPALLARPEGPITAAERLGAENDVRGTLLQAIAGAVVFAGLYVTWRTFDLNRQGQVTERFTSAIEQLGSDQRAVRVGAIYALERIAQDSERDHRAIVEVLNAYIRDRAPTVRGAQPAVPQGSKIRPMPDVQAALTVLGRRRIELDDPSVQLRLSDVDLRGASLRGGHFEGVRLRRSRLENARCAGAHLEEAKLRDAHLEGAHFTADPDLDLEAAHLDRANLQGAHLEGAHLTGTQLEGASYSHATSWPLDFDPAQRGCILVADGSPQRAPG